MEISNHGDIVTNGYDMDLSAVAIINVTFTWYDRKKRIFAKLATFKRNPILIKKYHANIYDKPVFNLK